MPKIYEYFGLIFLFYSNDHLPIHVHVKSDERESKFVLKYEGGKLFDVIQVNSKTPLSERQTRNSIKFIKKYHKQITEKWYDFFVLHKSLKCRKVNTKIK
jgi:hypothetical protein